MIRTEIKENNQDFEDKIHSMFEEIWDCEIDHPAYQETVGELMADVIQAYRKSVQPTSRWKTYRYGNEDPVYSCERCGTSAAYAWYGGRYAQRKWYYCSHCGAKMEEGKKDD